MRQVPPGNGDAWRHSLIRKAWKEMMFASSQIGKKRSESMYGNTRTCMAIVLRIPTLLHLLHDNK